MKKIFFSLFVLSALLVSCKEDDEPQTFEGEHSAFATGNVHSTLTVDAEGAPSEIAIFMDNASYKDIEKSGDLSVALDMPAEAVNLTGFRHALFDWAAHGHEPANVYDKPHFDVHFYYSTDAERAAITLADSVKANIFPEAGMLPATYFPTGVVPNMGNHWLDALAGELGGALFGETLIYGTFNGKVTFVEPMITKKYVDDNNATFEKDIKQPAKYQETGKYFPTKFGVRKDDEGYYFYMAGFVKR